MLAFQEIILCDSVQKFSHFKLCVVVTLTSQEVEAGEFRIRGQPRSHDETLSQSPRFWTRDAEHICCALLVGEDTVQGHTQARVPASSLAKLLFLPHFLSGSRVSMAVHSLCLGECRIVSSRLRSDVWSLKLGWTKKNKKNRKRTGDIAQLVKSFVPQA